MSNDRRAILPMPSVQGSLSRQSGLFGAISQTPAKAHSPIFAAPPPFVKQVILGLTPLNLFNPLSIPVTEIEESRPSYYRTITCCKNCAHLRTLSLEELRLADMFALVGLSKDAELCEVIDGQITAPSVRALKVLNERRYRIRSINEAGEEIVGGFVGRRSWETEVPLIIAPQAPVLSVLPPGRDGVSRNDPEGFSLDPENLNRGGLENSLCKPVPPTLPETEDQSIDGTTSECSNSSTVTPLEHSQKSLSASTMSIASLTFGEPDVGLSTAEDEWEDAKRDLALRKAALVKAKDEYDAAVERETAKFRKYCTLRLVSD
ncbi:hypothetical protein FRB94_013260 [Tulasnella sp. JGI-2019a]|nr:hypothetical protein FRB93_001966 [Tulasnella sp. JGI-2019a]KAG9008436.1 hypothetical protein FRB94_013260 [Tulasnella sp. JGI-2019a]KAG9031441.1 hypothetical protein FRB95_002741 [Tulasnella sp. JGI-2019a]